MLICYLSIFLLKCLFKPFVLFILIGLYILLLNFKSYSIPLLDTYPSEMKRYVHVKTYS